MADQPTGPSGSRWEPDPDGAPTAETPAAADTPDVPLTEHPYAAAADVAALDEPAAEDRRTPVGHRAVLAGAATALALGGGLAGFMIGHTTAGDDRADFRPANLTGQGSGGQFGEGQQVPPSFGGRDGDPDGDHVGGGRGLEGDGSGSSSGGSGSSGSSGSSSSTQGSGTAANPT